MPDNEKKSRPQDMAGLIRIYKQKHPDGHFFDRETLKFFGERLSEMRLLKTKARIKDVCGDEHICYVVSSVQRPGAPLTKRRKYHYFDTTTLDDVCT